MGRIVVLSLVLQTFIQSAGSCSDYQKAFGNSCFEFVSVRRSFFDAQEWCEQTGGHLAFIPNEETQHFLQMYLDAHSDWWLGMVSTYSPNSPDSTDVEAHLSWLDGSNLIYTNWVSKPPAGAACGHIQRKTACQWEATTDCEKKLQFICQFGTDNKLNLGETGRAIVCPGDDGLLRCGSGKVIVIDGGFYGRKNTHTCRSRLTNAIFTKQQCSWVSAVESLIGHCEGKQMCQTFAIVEAFDDPCPLHGSYLSVDYRCKDGLILSVSTVAAVFDEVDIRLKWLTELSGATLRCRLSTGDGHSFDLHHSEGLDSRVIHKYSHPSVFVVAAECPKGDTLLTAQKIINTQERITELRAIKCYAQNLSLATCKALYGSPLLIHLQVKSGTNLTLRVHSDGGKCLFKMSVDRFNGPLNVTVSPEMLKELGLGCHQLRLNASNLVTFPEVSTLLQVCVLEEVAGLQAAVISGKNCESTHAPPLSVGVSLRRGAPVQLLFFLTGDNSSFSESRHLLRTAQWETYHIAHPIQGTLKMTLKAWNAFSSVEVEVDMCAPHDVDSQLRMIDDTQNLPALTKREEHIRVVRAASRIIAQPTATISRFQTIELTIRGRERNDPEWSCEPPCKCPEEETSDSHTITEDCLPEPFQYFQYNLRIDRGGGRNSRDDNICITVAPKHNLDSSLGLQCIRGCNSASSTSNAQMKLTCSAGPCPHVVWNIEDPRPPRFWPTKRCYVSNEKKPLVQKIEGGNEYTVQAEHIAAAKRWRQNLDVVAYYVKNSVPYYLRHTIHVSSSSSTPRPTTVMTTPSSTTTVPPTSASGEIGTLACQVSPGHGNALDSFKIRCSTQYTCPQCRYCFKIQGGKRLLCSNRRTVKSVFLPAGPESSSYDVVILASAKYREHESETTITVKVRESAENSELSVDELKSTVSNAVEKLKEGGLLSGDSVAQILQSVSRQLDSQTDEAGEAARNKLREKMLDIMVSSARSAPNTSPEGVEAIASALAGIVKKDSDLSASSQRETSSLLESLSSSLINPDIEKTEENKKVAVAVVDTLLGTVVNILTSAADADVSYSLLETLHKLQSAILWFQSVDQPPTIIQRNDIGIAVSRKLPGSLQNEPIQIPNNISVKFSIPALAPTTFSTEGPVDVRMLHLNSNPFPWRKQGNISGVIGSLSLTQQNGSVIPVENSAEYIEILFPRPAGETVNRSILDLGMYSTMSFNVSSTEATLVLKMEPSVNNLPFKVYLGHESYPNDANHIAMTQLPHEETNQGERYTWLLHPDALSGRTGLYFLVVRPIVGPGLKSINATLSVTPISAGCKFWNERMQNWSTDGCVVGANTSHRVTQCLCNHLTVFGSSFFVTPNLVDPSRSAELFSTFAQNPVVVCFVGALFVGYVIVVVWARYKDIQDTAKVKVTALEDNDPMDEYGYLVCVCTGHRRGASTSSQVIITLLGAAGSSEPHHLTDDKKSVFERGGVDMFLLTTTFPLGDLQGVRLWHNNSGESPAWYVSNVVVQDMLTHQKWHFLCNSWLALDVDECCLDKVFPVSSKKEMKRFSNLFFMKTTKDFSDGHLWFSVVSRPASSNFTRVQRVSCCFSLLLCTMLTSIMFYGIPADPSEQSLDLGQFEFTWQQFMIGIQSSLIMFPVNLLIVSIFRYSRPCGTSCCKSKAPKNVSSHPATNTQLHQQTKGSVCGVSSECVFKDLKKMIAFLSKSTKNYLPITESDAGLGQQADIKAALSVVEDFIRLNMDTDDITAKRACKAQSLHSQYQPQLPEENVGGQANTKGGDDIQRRSKITWHLYRKLCHIQMKLRLLADLDFSSSHSYKLAEKQVESMKDLLQEHISTASSRSHGGTTETKSTPHKTDSSKKRRCCHGGLPWWFVFAGWLLVFATSGIAGYFTMLYGLKFGKERSISWLVSMIISFFQSLLVIQPLKVLFLAFFIALVTKKVEEVDFPNFSLEKRERIQDEHGETLCMIRRDNKLYEPPLPADIEKMRRYKIKQQKAFALLKEILIYTGFLWMLLLVAYGQRDPNAFFLTRHIRQSFDRGISESMSISDVFSWADTCLLRNLFGIYPGFITDGNSKLVGNARLRQVRVQRNLCPVSTAMHEMVAECQAQYSWEGEDTASYDPGWATSFGNVSERNITPWVYQTQDQLRTQPIWGKLGVYRGGGFAVELGPDLSSARSTLHYLFKHTWLDKYTRAVFVEFTVYNANVNLFCIVTLIMETAAVGAFEFRGVIQSIRLYQSTDGFHIFIMAAEVTYLIFVLYYMFLQAMLMRQQKWAYLRSAWNLLDLIIILLSWSALSVFIARSVLGQRDITFYHNHRDQFPSFYETAAADLVLQYLIAFLVLLATLKLWHLLRLNPKMNMLTASLRRAWTDISGLLIIITIMLMAYSIACNLLYGWKMSSYRTLLDAVLTIISLQMGVFNYVEVLDYNLVLGALIIGSCVVLMTFVVLNLLISMILMALTQEQIHHKPSEEEEIVDFILMKFSSFFGSQRKAAEEEPGGPEEDGSTDSAVKKGIIDLNIS